MNKNVTSALALTAQHFRHLGLDLPSALSADLAALDEKLRHLTSLRADPNALPRAVAAALEAGKDPATDKAVLLELSRRQLDAPDVNSQIEVMYDDQRADVLRKHAPAVVAVLADVVAESDRVLAEAREKIPGLDLEDVNFLRSLRSGHMSLWGQARDASERAQRAVRVWHQIARACDLSSISAPHLPLILADLDPAEYAALASTKLDAVIRAGHRLSLATPEEYIERCRRLAAVEQVPA